MIAFTTLLGRFPDHAAGRPALGSCAGATATDSCCAASPSCRSCCRAARARGRLAHDPRTGGRTRRASSRRDGVKIHYEVHGDGGPDDPAAAHLDDHPQAVLEAAGPLPGPPPPRRHLRRARATAAPTGRSTRRPTTHDRQVAARRRRARRHRAPTGPSLVGLSKGAQWALQLAGEHGRSGAGHGGHRRLGAAHRAARRPGSPPATSTRPRCRPRGCRCVARDPLEHWAKYDPGYWEQRHEDFLWFFFGMCFPEPRSTKPIEDCVGWGLDTVPEVLTAEMSAGGPAREAVEGWCAAHHLTGAGHPRRPRPDQPVVPRSADRRADRRRVRRHRGRRAHPAGPRPGQGQPPDPRLRRTRWRPTRVRRTWSAGAAAAPGRSSTSPRPIGLGHARRDLAVARRSCGCATTCSGLAGPAPRHPGARGGRRDACTRPARALASESGHIESRVRRARPALLRGAPPDGRDPGQQLPRLRRRGPRG